MGKKSQNFMQKAPKRLKSQAKPRTDFISTTKYVKPETLTRVLQILGEEIALALDQDSIRVFRQTNHSIRSAFQWNAVTDFADLTQLDQELENSGGIWICAKVNQAVFTQSSGYYDPESSDYAKTLVGLMTMYLMEVHRDNPHLLRVVCKRECDEEWTIGWIPVLGNVGVYGGLPTFRKPRFYKMHWDHNSGSFGSDTHGMDLNYPIWYMPNAFVSPHVSKRLLDTVSQLDALRNDVQENGVTHDIVDCDLLPRYFKNTTKEGKIARMHNRLKARNRRVLQGMKENNWEESVTSSMLIREAYHWIPANVTVSLNNVAKFTSPIHNLLLMEIMQNQDSLQFVVKIQEYVLKPGMTYKGMWHVEGFTENIVAAGTYYLRIDEGLEGGNLKFRPEGVPNSCYGAGENVDCQVTVEEGSMVVFSNRTPHRFRKMTNSTSKTLKRTFINFFLVDPSRKLKVAKRKNLNNDAALKGSFFDEARDKRKDARVAMTRMKTGWGMYCWGNAGTVEFMYDLSHLQHDEGECRWAKETDSGNAESANSD
ncbi:UNVERIFIED_CONTAM: hypothetical protein HDU68_009639 [Siphonaria sp. JEL0065]|nr:hypothetical protein HDU68_009639 [Siphonaria sp. JEL0065]